LARNYGKINKYQSQLRRCAVSGLRFYEHEMVRQGGNWVYHKYADLSQKEGAKREVRGPR
jgi:endonuclease YncB( thermonuclease family)